MDKYVHALLIDRKGFEKILVGRFNNPIRVIDTKPSSIIEPGECIYADNNKMACIIEFFFEEWIKEGELGIWIEK